MHLFCLHHAGGTAASFSAWRFPGVDVTKLGYRGREFNSVAEAADQVAQSVAKSPAPRLALYGHSMGALLAYEAALRLEHTGRVAHVFLAASGPHFQHQSESRTSLLLLVRYLNGPGKCCLRIWRCSPPIRV